MRYIRNASTRASFDMTLLVLEHSIPLKAREGTPQKEKLVVD
jgi:hypothetical protein